MKYLFSILILFTALFSATAAELPDNLQKLQEELGDKLKIISVDDDDFKDDDDNKFFVLKVVSSQDERATDLTPLMRVTVQLLDRKSKTTVFAQAEKKSRPLPGNNRYGGSTRWEFHVPFGDMKRPKLTAYAVEFGVNEGGTFVAGASEYDKVDSADEIMDGKGTKVKMTCPVSKHDTTSEGNN